MRYWLLFIVIWAWSIDYHHVGQQDPSGIHFIRQTDGLSFASQYFHRDDFLEPATFNQNAENGQVACEFPIFYYLTAQVYHYTGIHFPVLRWIHGCISLMALLFLFQWFRVYTKNFLLILGMALFWLSSVVYGYYAFNFLPDAPAFAFAISGWSCGWIALNKKSGRYWMGAALFFGLAGLMKPTFFIHGIAFSLTLLALRRKNQMAFPSKWNWTYWGIIILSVIGIFSWNAFVSQYNTAHHDDYFLITTRPIWKMDQESIRIVWDHINHYWHRDYLARDVWKCFWVMLIMVVLRWKWVPQPLKFAIVWLFLGSLSYFILFFGQFRDHDYYALNIFPLFMLIGMAFIAVIVESIQPSWIQWLTVIIVLAVGISGWKTNNQKLRYRWVERDTYYAGVSIQLKDGAQWTQSIPKDEPIAVIPDRTRNGSLLFTDHIGYTVFDSTQVDQIARLRADRLRYVIVLDSQYLQLPEIIHHWQILEKDTANNRYILGNPF